MILLFLTVNFKNHTSMIIISQYIREFNSVYFLPVALFYIHLCYIFSCTYQHDYTQNFSQSSLYRCLENMSWCLILINLINQAFLTAAHLFKVKSILWKFWFSLFIRKLECKNENTSSVIRRDKLCLLARLLQEMVGIMPNI